MGFIRDGEVNALVTPSLWIILVQQLRRQLFTSCFAGIGASVARLEAAETLDALLDRFTGLEMGSGPYEYAANPSFRGLSTFSVRGTR